ncbi:MAG: hypothetical protein WDN46_12695 [Methylocella sp.]
MENSPRFLRRDAAAAYLKTRYGFGSVKSLAKGVVTGDSPLYRKAGRIVLYELSALDTWAMAKIGAPVRSSSETKAASARPAPDVRAEG